LFRFIFLKNVWVLKKLKKHKINNRNGEKEKKHEKCKLPNGLAHVGEFRATQHFVAALGRL
jgi:hypothetical protein